MGRFLTFFTIFCLIVIGCTKANPKIESALVSENYTQVNVFIDHKFSVSEENDITNGLKSIECSVNYKIRFKVYYDAKHEDYSSADPKSIFIWYSNGMDERIVEADKKLSQDNDAHRFVVGLFASGGINHADNILLVMDRITINTREILMHEVLHALGLGHSSSQNSIMYRFTDKGANRITDLDVKNISDIYHFDPSGMKACDLK